jgi:hypothetical protein
MNVPIKWIAFGALELKFWNFFAIWSNSRRKASDISTLVTEFLKKKQVEELFNKNSEEWVVIPNYDVPVSEVKEVYEQKHTKDRGV